MEKLTRQPRCSTKEIFIKCPLDPALSNVVGPMTTSSLGGIKYFVTLPNEYSACSMVRFVERKCMAGKAAIDMIKSLKNKLNQNIQSLYVIG